MIAIGLIISLAHDHLDVVHVHSRVAFPHPVSSYPIVALTILLFLTTHLVVMHDSIDPNSLHRLHFEMDIEDAMFAPSDRKYAYKTLLSRAIHCTADSW